MEIYVSTDIETNGPIPGAYSMLSLGSGAFREDGVLMSTFAANLAPLPEASVHPETMRWWASYSQAWEASTRDPQPPAIVMEKYATWIRSLGAKPVFVAFPAGFDFTFVYWYFVHFTGACPFEQSALDIKTLAMALTGHEYGHLISTGATIVVIGIVTARESIPLKSVLSETRRCFTRHCPPRS